MVLNCSDVKVVDDVNRVLMIDVHNMDVLDEVVDKFIP